MSMYVVPVEFLDNSPNPKDPHLFEAVQKYAEREFGNKLELYRNLKTWAVVSQDDSGYVVHGLTSLRYMIDCPTFHITPGVDDETQEAARTVRELLFRRASSFIQDLHGTGTRVMVFVAPERERFWKAFLRLIKAKAASRWEVQV